jgi:hypothetical protein
MLKLWSWPITALDFGAHKSMPASSMVLCGPRELLFFVKTFSFAFVVPLYARRLVVKRVVKAKAFSVSVESIGISSIHPSISV